MSEHDEQVALFKWAAEHQEEHPELGLMFAIPNGGKRHPGVGKKLKAEGLKAGVPDIFLPVPNAVQHGLFIEMKIGYSKPRKDQRKWLSDLWLQGYGVAVCYGAEHAKAVIADYLQGVGIRQQEVSVK